MDIDVIIDKLNDGLALALNIKGNQDTSTAITGGTSGSLVVNETTLSVSGSNFETLLGEQITALDSAVSADLTALDAICDDIKAEIIA